MARRVLGFGLALVFSLAFTQTEAQQRPAALPAADEADQPIQTAARNPDAVAVVVGISQYQDRDIPPAIYAGNDADAVVRVLTVTLGYSPQRILQFKNEQASGARFKSAVRQRLAALIQPGKSDVFFYYSGHGEPNVETREGYLLPYDFDSQDQPTADTAYGISELKADLAKLNPRSVTVVLEACFTGQSKAGPLIKSARPVVIAVEDPARALSGGLPNSITITASGAAELASDHPERPHGLMTYYWLRAMRGEAADDTGRVTPDRLKQYLQEKVLAAARGIQRTQTPEVLAAQPNLELARLPVSLLRTGDARVVERTGGLELFIDLGGDLSIDGTFQKTLNPGDTYQVDTIKAGPHHIEVRKQGYETKQDDLVIIPDQVVRKTYLLSANLPTAGRLDRVYGLIQVSVDRGGSLYIDDKKEADLPPFAPYTTPRIEAGPHRVRVEKQGFATIDQEILVRPNETSRIDLALSAGARVIPGNSVPGNDASASQFPVVPQWLKALPASLKLRSVNGIAVDAQDNVWIVGVVEGPPVQSNILKFDRNGKFLVSIRGNFGDWPQTASGISVDSTGVWVGSGASPAARVFKFALDGKLLVAITGREANAAANVNSLGVNAPVNMEVDAAAHELYVADGQRIVVFDSDTGKFKRYWGAYGNKPSDQDPGAYNPGAPPASQFRAASCARVSNDGLVYVCDRRNDRVQVFRKDGRFVKEVFISKATVGEGSVWDLAFSKDAQQRFMYVGDGQNHKVWVLNRDSLDVVSSFDADARNIAVDSNKGIYTGDPEDGLRKFVSKN